MHDLRHLIGSIRGLLELRAADPGTNVTEVEDTLTDGYAAALELERGTGGSLESIPDVATAAAIRRTAANEGTFVETAGGVTVAAVEAARRRGVIRDGDEVVAILSGNGVKTPDARRFGVDEAPLAPPIGATYDAFSARFGS